MVRNWPNQSNWLRISIVIVAILPCHTMAVYGFDEDEPTEVESKAKVVRYRLKEAKKLLADDKAAEAILILNRALVLDSKNGDVHARLADALKMQHKYQASLLECNKAIALNPENAEAWHRRATVYSALKMPSQAIKSISQAIALKPEKHGFLLSKAAIDLEAGDAEAAIGDLHRYLNVLKPEGEGKKRCYMMILKCCTRLRNPTREKTEFSRFILNYPEVSRGYEYRGYSYLRQEKFALAAADLRKALEMDPKNEHCRDALQKALHGRKGLKN